MSTPKTPFYPMTHDDAVLMNTRLAEIRNNLAPGGRQGVIYGVHIDGNESDPEAAVSYVGDAVDFVPAGMNYATDKFSYGSWGDAFFLPRACMLKYDGTVDYYLDPNDYSKKEDGTASDVSDPAYGGNAMMEWGRDGKQIWYAIVPDTGDDASATIWVADYQVDERFHARSFTNGENALVAHFYTPCYFGTLIDSRLRSLSGQSGADRCKNTTAAQEQTAAKANDPAGVDIWEMECFADTMLIQILLILMGKSLNTRAVFGEGLHTSGSDAVNNGFTSGQHDTKGLFYGTNSGEAATYANAVKVFGMENWYGFMWRRIVGLVLLDGAYAYKLTRGTEDGSTATDYATGTSAGDYAGYIQDGSSAPASSGNYISQMRFSADHFLPKAVGGSAATYYGDGLWVNASGVPFARHGGLSDVGAMAGAFCLRLNAASSSAHWNVGAAPSCKPLS